MWLLFVNQAFADIHGYSSPEAILALERFDALVAPQDDARLTGYVGKRLRDGGAPVRCEYEAMHDSLRSSTTHRTQ